MEMGSDEKFALLRSIADECIYEDELCVLLKKKPNPICYVWFEPTSMMGIEQLQDEIGADIQKIQMQNEEMFGH